MAEDRNRRPRKGSIRPQTISTSCLEWRAGLDRRGRRHDLEEGSSISNSRAVRAGQSNAVEAEAGTSHSSCNLNEANKPQADNLKGSGIESVLMTSLYAIVGAVALERGGAVANKVVQDKILAPLGFSFSADA